MEIPKARTRIRILIRSSTTICSPRSAPARPYNEAENGAISTMMAILGRMCTYSGKVLTWEEAINSQMSVMPKEYSWQATPPTLPDSDGW